MTKQKRQKISEAMIKVHAYKRLKIDTYEAALIKIYKMPTSGARARNVAARALKIATRA